MIAISCTILEILSISTVDEKIAIEIKYKDQYGSTRQKTLLHSTCIDIPKLNVGSVIVLMQEEVSHE